MTLQNKLTQWIVSILLLAPLMALGDEPTPLNLCQIQGVQKLSNATIANELGWVTTNTNRCGGYYHEPAFILPSTILKDNYLNITGNEGVFSLHGTSIYQGNVTITQDGQQIIANEAYVYREPATEKYSAVDLIGNVILREPNQLILAKCGRLELPTKNKSLHDILYRTAIYGKFSKKPSIPTNEQIRQEHKVTQLTAWGQASEFKQDAPKIYQLQKASYTTCPPLNNVWQVKANDIVINKITGRGEAKNARLYIRGVPVFYTPYLNFPIDDRRQTGFLWPRVGSSSSAGFYLATPFYWNIAPNYDDIITPTYMNERGLQIDNLYRYLTHKSHGEIQITVLPDDQKFSHLQSDEIKENLGTTNPITLAELSRLENASLTRKALIWQDKTHYNDNWSSELNINWVSDDYYLKDFRNNLTEITPNQLLQEVDLHYKSPYWHFLGRVQGYQTLHPVDENFYNNQYLRLPELALEGYYTDDRTGLEYFIYNDLNHFEIRKNPGTDILLPVGNRFHVQPGISRPYYLPYFYFTPRLQAALTEYNLQQIEDDQPHDPSRALPIFDIHSGLYFDRHLQFFSYSMRQTLEPQIYYSYVPFRNQNDIPIFDTTLNTLTYDQLFTYNRFSGLDRIGDTNQLSLGATTRFIDEEFGTEKIRAGLGMIVYFEDRKVTLCDSDLESCQDSEEAENNKETLSPLSAMIKYNLAKNWSITSDTIYDVQQKQLDNQMLSIDYSSDIRHRISLTYSYVPDNNEHDPLNELDEDMTLSQTDLSFTWPLTRDWSSIGRWTQNWSEGHFKNLLYGLQYDSCCWAVRFVAGRTYTNATPDNTYEYDTEFYIQFALKGLGNVGTGNTGQITNSIISANKSYFGQDY